MNKEIKKGKKEELNKNWEYIKNKINDRRTKKSWQTIKNILNEGDINKTQEYLKDDNDNKIYNKQDIANSFMNNQKEIFVPNKSNNDREHYLREHWHKNKTFNKRTKNGPYDLIFSLNGEKSFYESDNKITPKEIMTALSKLKNDKAPGIYGIKNNLLLTIKEELAPALVELFNDCLNMSYFPDSLKVAKIIMIPKAKNTKNIADHRPISLLPTIGKLLEQILAQRVYARAENNNKINEEQSGFRKHRSTVDHLFQFVQDHQTTRNEKRKMHAVFIDFEKAFDKINHSYLLKKLHTLDIPSDLLNIIHSFLENRKGFINYGNFKSEIFDILAGVPQGSCLSPILFSLFVSDIPKPPGNIKLSQFADNIVVWFVFLYMWNNELEKYVNKLIN